MSNENQFEDITNNFLEVHDIEVSHLNVPNNPARIMLTIDYDRQDGEKLPEADEIINCLTPAQARLLIECLQQSLDELGNDVPTFENIQKH